MIDKNKSYKCKITDLTINGDGVGKVDNYPLFIKGAIPGDEIIAVPTKLNKTYGFARIKKLAASSPYRRKSVCNSFPKCGGCLLLHQNYEGQLSFKSDLVLSNIKKISDYAPESFDYEGIIPCENEYYYRNKAQFPVRNVNGKAVCGFYEQRSHSVIDCEYCHIQNKCINKAVEAVMNYINENNIPPYDEISGKGIVRHIYVRYSEENTSLMVVVVTNTNVKLRNTDFLLKSLLPLGLKSLVQNINTKKTNVVLGDKNITIFGDDHIYMQTDDLKFKVSPHSFFQVNTAQMKKLYSKAIEYASLTGNETVFDLYCGVGSISLFMAKKAKNVIGVEIVPPAIENAKENAKINGIDNASFYCGDCTEVVDKLIADGKTADVVIVDPPRKGCDEKLLSLINKISPQKLVYVSCNSATLARDLCVLKEYGYTLKKACAVDLFPQSTHCEVVCSLQR